MNNYLEPLHQSAVKPTKFDFIINEATPTEVVDFLAAHHYLGDKWRPCYNYGLYADPVTDGLKEAFSKPVLVGVCIFGSVPSNEVMVSMLGRDFKHYPNLVVMEMSRLCIDPRFQVGGEYEVHNITSWFASACMRLIKAKFPEVEYMLSYAESSRHDGTIYQAMNFGYHGVSPRKNDFWRKTDEGEFIKVNRGSVIDLEGEWRPRPIKHRYVYSYRNNRKGSKPVLLWKKVDKTEMARILNQKELVIQDVAEFLRFATSKGYSIIDKTTGEFEAFRLKTPDGKTAVIYKRTRTDILTVPDSIKPLVNEWKETSDA